MKKILIISICLLIGFATKAQLNNTSWSANFNIPDEVPMILEFKSDTLLLKIAETGENFEVMQYFIKGDTLTYTKISGGSDCGSNQNGVYKINIKDDILNLELINDECESRANANPATRFKKCNKLI